MQIQGSKIFDDCYGLTAFKTTEDLFVTTDEIKVKLLKETLDELERIKKGLDMNGEQLYSGWEQSLLEMHSDAQNYKLSKFISINFFW